MGKTVESGYGEEHKRIRAQYAKEVEAGHGWCCEIVCVMSSRWIPPGSKWHLAHTPDKTAYRGPAHSLCNVSEAGKRGNPKGIKSTRKPQSWRPTTQW